MGCGDISDFYVRGTLESVPMNLEKINLNVIDAEIPVYMKLSPYFCEINSFYAIMHH